METRLQQPYLEKIFGVKIVVEYKPGAGEALAWTQFAKANPGKITIGISGKLSGHHMASLQFEKQGGWLLCRSGKDTGAIPLFPKGTI